MPNVSTLTVRLSANSAKLVAEFNRAQRRAKTFGDRVRGSLRIVGKAFAGVGAAGTTALLGLSTAGIQAGDNLAKTAAKLGIAADELVGLRFAAEQTGVDVRKLDLGLQRMVRRVAEAAQGTGEAQKALKELGLDARELARLAPDEQFRRLSDAFAGVASQSDKVRLGFKLFDSEGVALVNTLAAGRTELERFADEARSFGLTLNGQQLRNVQDAADAQNRASRAFAGLGRQLGATLAPAIEKSANALAGFVSRVTQSIPSWAAWASAIFNVRREVELLTKTEIEAEMAAIMNRVGRLVDEVDRQRERLSRGSGVGFIPGKQEQTKIDQLQSKIGELTERYNQLKSALENTGSAAETLTNTVVATGPTPRSIASLEAVRQKWSEISTEFDRIIAKQRELESVGASIFSQTRNPVENFVARMKEAREALDRGLLPGGEETLERYRQQLLDDLVPAIGEVEKASNNLNLVFSSAFEDAIVEGKKFSEVLKGIYQDILRIVVRKSITEPLGNLFASAIGGLIPGRALGGSVMAGGLYMTGERGKELFVPKTDGQIIPNNKLGGLGGVTVVNNNHFNADANAAKISEVIPLIEQGTRNAVAEVMHRRREGNL